MTIRNELLVFSKKEIFIIITLLILVALFSFTIGLKMGKEMAQSEMQGKQGAVLTAEAEAEKELPVTHLDKPSTYEHEEKQKALVAKVENVADKSLNKELKKEKVTAKKVMPMHLPKHKKADVTGVRYTLQVGSHRTVAEAAEQVRRLKRRDLDAFYLEAKLRNKGTWYRVGIGVFTSKLDAEKAGTKWKRSKKNFPAYLVQKVTQ